VACEKDAQEREHQRLVDDAKDDDQRVRLPFHGGEGRQNHGIKCDRRDHDPPPRANFLAKVSVDARVNDHVHHEVKERAERGDAAEIKKDRQKTGNHDGIDQRVVLDRARHAEMAVRDHLHLGQHGQHPRHRENARASGPRP